MGDATSAREAFTVIFLCIIWYFISSSSNIVGKLVLNDFPYPMTVTMVQLLSIVIFSGPVFSVWGVRKQVEITSKYSMKFIFPLAFAKFFVTVFSQVSIWKVPVSYAHTVKATLPLFTVVLSRVLVGEKQTFKVYLSLVPIIAGVIIASVTEISFNLIGLVSALLSTSLVSVQHIYSKQVMRDTGMHHLRLLQILGRWAFLMFLPVWMFTDMINIEPHQDVSLWRVGGLLCLDGMLAWLQNVVAFSVLSLVTPLTYAVASAAKRIAVIAASLVLLQNPVTQVNVMGMMLAVFGVLAYNKAKYDQRHTISQPLLPVHLNNNNSYKKLQENGTLDKREHSSIFVS